jgi:hypothetical protein
MAKLYDGVMTMVSKTATKYCVAVHKYPDQVIDEARATASDVYSYLGRRTYDSFGVLRATTYGLCTIGVRFIPLIESSPQVQRQEVCSQTTGITLVYFLAFLLFARQLYRFVKWLSPRLPLIYAALQQAGPPPPATAVPAPAIPVVADAPTNPVAADAPVGTPAAAGVPGDVPVGAPTDAGAPGDT